MSWTNLAPRFPCPSQSTVISSPPPCPQESRGHQAALHTGEHCLMAL